MITLECNYSKKIGLPGYSTHQFSVSLKTELSDASQVQAESSRLYHLLQNGVDTSIREIGWLPGQRPLKDSSPGFGHGARMNLSAPAEYWPSPNNMVFDGMMHGGSFGGLFDGFTVAVADVTGVVIIAGVGIVRPIRVAFKRRTLLNLCIALRLPQYARHNMRIKIIVIKNGQIPRIKCPAIVIIVLGNGIKIGIVIHINMRGNGHLPQVA